MAIFNSYVTNYQRVHENNGNQCHLYIQNTLVFSTSPETYSCWFLFWVRFGAMGIHIPSRALFFIILNLYPWGAKELQSKFPNHMTVYNMIYIYITYITIISIISPIPAKSPVNSIISHPHHSGPLRLMHPHRGMPKGKK